MELSLSKKEIEEIIKEHYRSPIHIEMGMSIKEVIIDEYSEHPNKFCVITLEKSK